MTEMEERRAERRALGLGGVPLFALMVAASLGAAPKTFLIPVLAVLVATTVMIAPRGTSEYAMPAP